MVSSNNPVESFINSVQVLKNAFTPLEIGLRRVTEDLENCWDGISKISENRTQSDYPLSSSDCSRTANGSHGDYRREVRRLKRKSLSENGAGDKSHGIEKPRKAFFFDSFRNDVRYKETLAYKETGMDELLEEESREQSKKGDSSCINCSQFAVTWSFLVNNVMKSLSSPFKTSKKKIQKIERTRNGDSHCQRGHQRLKKTPSGEDLQCVHKRDSLNVSNNASVKSDEAKTASLECLLIFIYDQLIINLQKLDQSSRSKVTVGSNCDNLVLEEKVPESSQVDHVKMIMSFWEGKRTGVNGFLGNLSFARVGGIPSSVIGISSAPNEENNDDSIGIGANVEPNGSPPQKLSDILSVPLSNVERLKSTLSTVSISELMELVPYIGRTAKDHPDKKKLFSVQDFFRYTESEGKRFFEELDRDGDGQVTLEDLEIVMRKRKLPRRYARELMQRTRNHIFAKSFGWRQFLSLMEQKEATILRAYTSLCLSKSGTLQTSEILASLKNAGLPANSENAAAMMRFLNVDTEKSISYGHFRNFMLLLPSENLQDDFRNIWLEAATVVPVAPPVEIPAGSVLRSALAGGLSCALSCCLMHPVDTIKTRVQASTLSFPEIISKLPQIGVRGVYRGSVPAILGQFSSHGLRTGIFEATRLVLINVAPTLPELQVQSIASFCSTLLGTAVRIPCEVLKQRLQAGIFQNVGEGIVGTWQQDGLRGFFRGTGATLCREVPFYVAGMGLYAESKKAVQQLLRRELEPWETIMVGALSGGLAAIATTPFDVMKTRMMTAPQGRPVSMSLIAFSILKHEGPLGLFKGALPRFFWIAPLGAMNFAGYELARKAMEPDDTSDHVSQKRATTSAQ